MGCRIREIECANQGRFQPGKSMERKKRAAAEEAWPALRLNDWRDTLASLHMWTQVVGKVRLALAPVMNHWWQVPLYVTCRGLTTSNIPHGNQVFHIDFDFIGHRVHVGTSDGAQRVFALEAMPVAEFYQRLMAALEELGIRVEIWPVPVEIPDPAIPFPENHGPGAYDREHVERFRQVMVQADRVLQIFRGRYLGKSSPVHFFWGGFDLALTRFSGRPAPRHPGGIPNVGDWVMVEAYSHEVSSAGFWPGSGSVEEAAFYSYAYPEPDGFRSYPVPEGSFYHPELREFILPYEAVRRAAAPDELLLDFLQSTYEAAADCGDWHRASLERG